MTTEKKIKLEYGGSKFWLIFWTLVFFPIALVLLALNGQFALEGKKHWVKYEGSNFWLCFWIVLCFPVALLLLFLNGVSLMQTDTDVPIV